MTARRRANALRPGESNAAPRSIDDDMRAPHAILDCFTPNPRNPRGSHPDLPGLAESLKVHGQLQPVVAISMGAWLARWPEDAERVDIDAHFVTLIGSSRLAAARLADCEGLDYTLRDDYMDPALYPLGPIIASAMENVHREDMTCLDEARLCQQVGLELAATQGTREVTADQIAAQFAKSRQWVAQRLGLLRLVQPAQDLLDQRAPGLSFRLAREASALPESEQMPFLLARIQQDGEGDTAVSDIVTPTKSETAVSLPSPRALTARQVRNFVGRAGNPRAFGSMLAQAYGPAEFAEVVAAGVEKLDLDAIDALEAALTAVRAAKLGQDQPA